jgi:hypothetical protein
LPGKNLNGNQPGLWLDYIAVALPTPSSYLQRRISTNFQIATIAGWLVRIIDIENGICNIIECDPW